MFRFDEQYEYLGQKKLTYLEETSLQLEMKVRLEQREAHEPLDIESTSVVILV